MVVITRRTCRIVNLPVLILCASAFIVVVHVASFHYYSRNTMMENFNALKPHLSYIVTDEEQLNSLKPEIYPSVKKQNKLDNIEQSNSYLNDKKVTVDVTDKQQGQQPPLAHAAANEPPLPEVDASIPQSDILDQEDTRDPEEDHNLVIEIEEEEDEKKENSDLSKSEIKEPCKSDFKTLYPNFAIGLKSGEDTLTIRTPIQLMTFLKEAKNVYVFAESPGLSIGNQNVDDVYSDLYPDQPSMPKKRKLNQKKKNRESPPEINQHTRGWDLDAHKNLPGLKKMWEIYESDSKIEWFFMIDDDTYLFLSNMNFLLSKYNSSLPYYFGNPNAFTGCDGVKKYGDGPNFAHGGSGIVISRGALEKLYNIIPNCITKYRTCWAGDIRTALCLRDVDIFVQRLSESTFNKEAPNFANGAKPCSLPGTFHHLLTSEIQQLFEIESNINTTTINYSDLHSILIENSPADFLKHMDMPGSDLRNMEVNDWENCKLECEKDLKCLAWSMTDMKICWLKWSIPYPSRKSNFTSGYISSRYVCIV